ncbi:uncharacterized protein LOC129598824 [Paramacrobiotus metropolitanus]|uniref:uncharacterized protein LOC129598824 n=1 Tax=Paramacrobiotus metropolitanus TaxID=2943436 RepID=UPI002445DCCC|nr:uncharacterized protein LOC129598824 [Paramacrobiotus metropolitanus]XP_055352867.1 uncharacterized protein LOC129598824 [Paramacrobiotus metropolitanus]XP_055352868.1 uncharacterized protein LOC129598824 [Paramacrobiotus metropolitanus]XP_055352869.1 uncharacterized protein LOC129598824 [Paramacrobiotus metropolitanus]
MPAEDTEEPPAPQPLIPHYYYRWMQVCGFHPYSLSHTPGLSRSDLLWMLWSGGLFILQAILLQIAGAVMWDVKGDEVSKLDHYALIQYTYINMFLAQYLIIAILCAVQMKNLYTQVELEVRSYLCFPKTLRKLDRRWRATAVYNVTFAISGAMTELIYKSATEPSDYWYRDPLSVWGYPVRNYVAQILRFIHKSSVYCAITVPYGILITLALHLRTEFQVIVRILGEFPEREIAFEALRLRYQRLLFAKDLLSDTFGVFIAVDCFCALLTWCALASETLHFDADHTDRTLLISSSFMMINSIVLLLALTLFFDTVSAVQRALRRIVISDPAPEIRDECDKFIGTCNAFDRAFSAMGCFSVTREYILALMAIFLTYLILIYQARDVQVKVNAIMRKDDIQYHSLADIILLNATAIPRK